MSVKANDSNKQVVSSGAKFTGLANMIVVSINPTMEELKARGLNPQKEQEYVTDEFVEEKNGVPSYSYKKNRLNITLFHPEKKFYAPLTIWLEGRVRWNLKHDKVEWINKFGNTAWSPDTSTPPQYDWFSLEGVRPAIGNEGVLTNFIKSWANCDVEDQAVLDDPMALAKGDYKEIKQLHKDISKNLVKVLNGIKKVEKDGKTNYYQTVYTGHFDRANRSDLTAWKKALEGEYSKFDADYQNDLLLREYTGGTTINGDSPTNLDVPMATSMSSASDIRF